MIERHRYQHRPQRFEYLPTGKATDLVPALLALVAWGDRWTAPAGPPVLFTHHSCGHDTTARDRRLLRLLGPPRPRRHRLPPRTRQPARSRPGTPARRAYQATR